MHVRKKRRARVGAGGNMLVGRPLGVALTHAALRPKSIEDDHKMLTGHGAVLRVLSRALSGDVN